MKWQVVILLSVALLVLGAIALTAMLTGEDGVVVAGVMSVVSSTTAGILSYHAGKHKQKKEHEDTTRRDVVPDP